VRLYEIPISLTSVPSRKHTLSRTSSLPSRAVTRDKRPALTGFSTRSFVKERPMLDLILLAVGLGFFALSIAYVYACDRL
jgi:hypothetical protein